MAKILDIFDLDQEVIDIILEHIETNLGGTIHQIDLPNQIIDIEVDDDKEEEAMDFLEKTISLYIRDRGELEKQNPFIGVIDMMSELDLLEDPEDPEGPEGTEEQ